MKLVGKVGVYTNGLSWSLLLQSIISITLCSLCMQFVSLVYTPVYIYICISKSPNVISGMHALSMELHLLACTPRDPSKYLTGTNSTIYLEVCFGGLTNEQVENISILRFESLFAYDFVQWHMSKSTCLHNNKWNSSLFAEWLLTCPVVVVMSGSWHVVGDR